ncbi:MAG: benzoylsuccinyl-CoA thiolase, partial [Acidimicrobiia bacterium]
MAKTKVPAIDGWFTITDSEPVLLGSRGVETGSYFFPRSLAFSRNPAAPGEELEEAQLGRRGRVWSYTTN